MNFLWKQKAIFILWSWGAGRTYRRLHFGLCPHGRCKRTGDYGISAKTLDSPKRYDSGYGCTLHLWHRNVLCPNRRIVGKGSAGLRYPFIPFDLGKMVAATGLGPVLQERLTRANLHSQGWKFKRFSSLCSVASEIFWGGGIFSWFSGRGAI